MWSLAWQHMSRLSHLHKAKDCKLLPSFQYVSVKTIKDRLWFAKYEKRKSFQNGDCIFNDVISPATISGSHFFMSLSPKCHSECKILSKTELINLFNETAFALISLSQGCCWKTVKAPKVVSKGTAPAIWLIKSCCAGLLPFRTLIGEAEFEICSLRSVSNSRCVRHLAVLWGGATRHAQRATEEQRCRQIFWTAHFDE